MAKVIHFEIPAENPEKVGQFYHEAFGWEINKWSDQDYWMITAGPKEESGVNGSIYKKGVNDKTMNTISVENLDEAINKVKKAGGEMAGEIMDIPKVGRFVYVKDVEGTPFGIMQPSKEYKNM